MYLLHRPWTRREALRFSLIVSFVPWTLLTLALLFLTSGPIQLEMGLLGAGFLSILFCLVTTLTVWLAGRSEAAPLPDTFRTVRFVLWAAILAGLLNALTIHLFPLNLFLAGGLQSVIVYRRLPALIQDPVEESVRIEPIAFAAVGIKAVILASLVAFSLLPG
ncbi:MAG: hypothetical protein ACKORA_05565 [Solirubrobacterales bacterium]